mgnify:CR=1 FL=1|tara:strand:+ start:18810 stop:19214 length:405 start_codon:yes stop_codon:yes gene_type:complete
MWPFTEKDPVKCFGEWKTLLHCNSCGATDKPIMSSWDSYDVCPECGETDVVPVVARWEESNHNYGIMASKVFHRCEIKEASKTKLYTDDNRLSKKFISEYLPKSIGHTMYGIPINELSKDELMATIAWIKENSR